MSNDSNANQSDNNSIMEIEHVSYNYTQQKECVFRDINMQISKNSFTAIVGRSGCGKTTLLNMLAGYLKPTHGKCKFNGSEIDGPTQNIIPIFQVDALLPWMKIRDNVMLTKLLLNNHKPTSDDVAHANMLIRDVDLDPDLVGVRYPKSLSEGMKKRIEIARALFAKPKIVLADEPFSNLDIENQESMHQLVKRIWQRNDITMVFSTHNLDEAIYLASEILVLNPKTPSYIVEHFKNEFQGQKLAKRQNPQDYYEMYDRIRNLIKRRLDGD